MGSVLQELAEIKTLPQATAAFGDEGRCRRLLEAMVWPRGRICPACGFKRSITLAGRDVDAGRRARPGLYQCSDGSCRFQFTVTTRTPLHATKLPLRTWLLAMFPVLVFMYARLARTEEREALAAFGPAYERYRHEVPGFIPRLHGAGSRRA